jgi:hypothetical protein
MIFVPHRKHIYRPPEPVMGIALLYIRKNLTCFTLLSCFAHSSTLKMEATCSSELSDDFWRTTRYYISGGRHFHYQSHEKFKSLFLSLPCGFQDVVCWSVSWMLHVCFRLISVPRSFRLSDWWVSKIRIALHVGWTAGKRIPNILNTATPSWKRRLRLSPTARKDTNLTYWTPRSHIG